MYQPTLLVGSLCLVGLAIAGNPYHRHEAPKWSFVVTLHFYYYPKWSSFTTTRESFCLGVIWNNDTILTSYFCFTDNSVDITTKPGDMYALVGTTWMERDLWHKDLLNSYAYKVKGYHLNKDNGLAVLRLEQPIDFAFFTKKQATCICDPEQASETFWDRCVAVGWWADEYQKRTVFRYDIVYILARVVNCESNVVAESCWPSCEYGMHMKVTYTPYKDSCEYNRRHVTKDIAHGKGAVLICPSRQHPNYVLVGLASLQDNQEQFVHVADHLEWILKAAGEKSGAENITTLKPIPTEITDTPAPASTPSPGPSSSATSSLATEIALLLAFIFSLQLSFFWVPS